MEESKKALIITDGTATTEYLAGIIAGIINGQPPSGYSAAVIQAENFYGSDILPVHAFFLGCEEPKPASFCYTEDLLKHINLSGRRCGVFSADNKALKYLSGIISSCEAKAGKPLLAKKGRVEDHGKTQKWIQSILK